MRRPGPDSRRPQAGFTLLELLVVMFIIGVMAVWGIPALLNTLNRARLVGAAKEVATLMQLARLEGIKKGGINGDPLNWVTVVRYNVGDHSFEALIDQSAENPAEWNPVTRIVGPYLLPKGVHLQAPTQSIEGPGAVDDWDVAPNAFDGPTFRSDGSVLKGGAFRLADERGNFLEVRVEFPATGKISIQKWFGGGDPDTNWFENGEGGNTWQW